MQSLEKFNDLSAAEVAAEMSISERKAWDLIMTGQLASYMVGRARRVRRESVDHFKLEHFVQPNKPPQAT